MLERIPKVKTFLGCVGLRAGMFLICGISIIYSHFVVKPICLLFITAHHHLDYIKPCCSYIGVFLIVVNLFLLCGAVSKLECFFWLWFYLMGIVYGISIILIAAQFFFGFILPHTITLSYFSGHHLFWQTFIFTACLTYFYIVVNSYYQEILTIEYVYEYSSNIEEEEEYQF